MTRPPLELTLREGLFGFVIVDVPYQVAIAPSAPERSEGVSVIGVHPDFITCDRRPNKAAVDSTLEAVNVSVP